MQGENGERWELLCKLAEQEQDPDKLLELAAAIERLLEEKQEHLEKERSPSTKDGTAA
jgi:predicted ATP-grasp superfamily ATP-dependent carboligase